MATPIPPPMQRVASLITAQRARNATRTGAAGLQPA